ncbi:MAG: VOC family protein [Chloroflexi bacterium]|nr:VOC family protein [Chloroflexota bacterium]
MNVGLVILNINSEQPQELMRFYLDVVGLPRHPDANRESTLMAGPLELVFDTHSAVHGKAPQPERMLLNLFVDDIAAEQQRLESAGVRFTRSQGREGWGGVISTFADPDGNYLQLIQFKPE